LGGCAAAEKLKKGLQSFLGVGSAPSGKVFGKEKSIKNTKASLITAQKEKNEKPGAVLKGGT